MRYLSAALAFLLSLPALAAGANPPVVTVATPPTGSCAYSSLVMAASNGHVYACVSGSWADRTPVTTSPLIAVGDLWGRSATGSVRVPVGVDGSVLVADSESSTGLTYRPLSWVLGGVLEGPPPGASPYSDEFDGTSTTGWTPVYVTASEGSGLLTLTTNDYRALWDPGTLFKLAPSDTNYVVAIHISSVTSGNPMSGNSAAGLRLFNNGAQAANCYCDPGGRVVAASGSTQRGYLPVSSCDDVYLGLSQTGTAWSCAWSRDGVSWETVAGSDDGVHYSALGLLATSTDASLTVRYDWLRVSTGLAAMGSQTLYPRVYAGPCSVGQVLTASATGGVVCAPPSRTTAYAYGARPAASSVPSGTVIVVRGDAGHYAADHLEMSVALPGGGYGWVRISSDLVQP